MLKKLRFKTRKTKLFLLSVVLALLLSCSLIMPVSAQSNLTYDLYNCTYEVTQGQPFEFQIYPDVYTPEWSSVTDTALRFPLAEYAAVRWEPTWILHIKDDSIQFSADQAYNFSFWVDLYGYPFTNAGTGMEWSDFAPETVKVTVGGQIVTSRVYVHQGSTPEWKRLTYAVPVEIRNYSGSLDMYIEFAFADHSTEILDEATPNIQIAMSRNLQMTVLGSVDEIVSALNPPIPGPENQDALDGSLSDYQQKEDQLLSNFDSGAIVDAVGDMNLSGVISAANVFTDCFSYLWDRMGKLQVVSQFAIVSGVVMMVLGLGVTVGNVMEVNRLGKLRNQERAAQAEQTAAWRRYLVGRHQQQDMERAQRMAKNRASPTRQSSYDIDAFKDLGFHIPEVEE